MLPLSNKTNKLLVSFIKSVEEVICVSVVWVVMPFGVKNGLPTYQRAIIKTFCDYIDVFMKIFLNGFIVFNDLLTHLEKFKKFFFKCREFGISLNLDKCVHGIFKNHPKLHSIQRGEIYGSQEG